MVQMDNWSGGPQVLVQFKVTFPGFEPLNDNNRPCMSLAPLYRPLGCVPLEFIVLSGNGTAPSDEAGFDNMRDLFRGQISTPGPYAFKAYEYGSDDARTMLYKKQIHEHMLIIDCLMHKPEASVKHNPVCGNHSRLANGNLLEYTIYGSQLKDAEQMDIGFRTLIKSFINLGEKQ